MKAFLLALLSFAVIVSAEAGPTKLLVSELDASVISKGLPLHSRESLKSGDGRKKQLWKIKGQDFGHFEVIGNNQKDADTVAWSCVDYDKAGNTIKETGKGSRCQTFFANVLRSVVDTPAEVAALLLTQSVRKAPRSAILVINDISIETDGQFYFIRHVSRL